MAPRRAAALAGALVLALAVCQTPVPATAQTASSWMQVFNMLLKPRTCANGKVLAVCRRDPCAVTDCPTGFKCKADYCGACAGVCEVDGSAPEEDKLAAGNAPTCELTGQPGKKAVRPQCSTPMCTYMQCGKGSACVNDFCGGCTGTCVNATETMVAGGALKPSIQGSTLASVTSCRAGEYMSSGGCRQCIPGSVSAPGASECIMCQMGSFANTATNKCDPCAPGTASAALRATSCAPCSGGRYSDKAGAVMCSACKEGFTTPRDKKPHTSCVVAPPAPVLPSKNGTGPGGEGSMPDGLSPGSTDDSSFDDLFEDLDATADAAMTGSDNRKAAKAAKLASMAAAEKKQ